MKADNAVKRNRMEKRQIYNQYHEKTTWLKSLQTAAKIATEQVKATYTHKLK